MKMLSDYCKKNLTSEQSDIYYDRLKNIPNVVFSEAVISIINSTSPSSFLPKPKDILQFWWNWKREHYQDIAIYPRTYCSECNGEGIIEYVHHVSGSYVDVRVARCASCENWRGKTGTFVPSLTKRELKEKGFKIIEKHEDRHKKTDRELYDHLYIDEAKQALTEDTTPF